MKNKPTAMPSRILLGVVCMLCLASCANIEVQKITDANRDSVRGIRYWRPAPYLVVSAGANHTCAGTIIYLPDPSEEYVLTPNPGFGAITFKPALADGWNLVSVDASVDSKASETFGVLGTALAALFAQPNTKEVLTLNPGIYRIGMDRQSGKLSLEEGFYRARDTPCATFAYGPGPAPGEGNKK